MKKRILLMLLAIVMLVGLMPTLALAAYTPGIYLKYDRSCGSVTATHASASEGTLVTIKPVPSTNYGVKTVEVTSRYSNPVVSGPDANGWYTFVMPSQDVDVKVDFAEHARGIYFWGNNTNPLKKGETTTLKIAFIPVNVCDETVTWESSNPSVATVDNTGKVTAVAPGTATITVTAVDGGCTATWTMTVNETYAITETPPTNGTFTVKVSGSEVTSAAENNRVTIMPTPAPGYEVETITVTKTASGDPIDVSGTGNTHTFTMPAEAITVSATFRLIHQHILCQTNGCTLDHNGDADGAGHDAVHFVPVSTQAELQYYATNGGSVYLKNSIELAETINVTGNLTLCLNGHEIKPANDFTGNAFAVSGTLVLTDCKGTGAITGFTRNCINNSGIFTLYAGKITYNTSWGVYNNGGTFTMNGGEISGNSGDGVYTTGVFTMNGGKITGNDRGVMYDDGYAYLSGAPVIQGNTNGNFCDYQGGYWLTVSGPLTDGAYIGVTLEEKFGVAAGPDMIDDTLPAAPNYIEYFHSDEGFEVFAKGDSILIGNNITEQPTTENNYTVGVNSTNGVSYQWYKVDIQEAVMTDENCSDASGWYDNYDAEVGWTAVVDDYYGEICYFKVDMTPDDVLTVTCSSPVAGELMVLDFDTVDWYTMAREGDTYTYTSTSQETHLLYYVPADGEDAPKVKATLTRVDKEAVDGQTEAALKTSGLDTGTYACQVSWDYLGTPDDTSDDWTVTSASVEYTAPAPAPAPDDYDDYDPTYPVVENKGEDPDGTVKFSSNYSTPGSTVTVTVTPDKYYGVEKVIVRNASGKEIETTKNADGTYSFKMPYGKVTVEAVYVWENPFVDVAEDTFYIDAVEWALKNGITEGTSETTFSPVSSCTRAQMVTFLWRAAGCPEPSRAVCDFTDVNMDSYYGKAVLWALEKGITNGTSETAFSPDMECSRAQMAAFLCRMADGKAESGKSTFVDVKADAYYAESVQWAVENGITNGTGEGMYSPDTTCTRGQMVTFLYRYFVK